MSSLEQVLALMAKWPRVCPNPACRVTLRKAFPACPACGEALTPARLKARAEAAADAGLGLPARKAWTVP